MDKVLIAVDESRGSRAVIPAFRSLIQKPRTVVLVTVQRLLGDSLVIDMLGDAEMQTFRESLKDTEHKQALDRRAELVLNQYTWEFENDGVIVRQVVRNGPPGEEILKVAREEAVNLIITGQRCKGFFSRIVKGSVSRELRKNSVIPVLVAKDRTCDKRSTERGTREGVDDKELRPSPVRVIF